MNTEEYLHLAKLNDSYFEKELARLYTQQKSKMINFEIRIEPTCMTDIGLAKQKYPPGTKFKEVSFF